MPNILPNAQFQFLADQRNKEFASSQQNQQVMQDNFKRAALTNQFNQAYKQYEQDKDVNKFEQNVRSLGMTYGNDKMASFKAQESSSMKPMYEYDEATGKTRHLGDVPKGAVVKTKPKQGINIQELKYYDAQKEKDQTNQLKKQATIDTAKTAIDAIHEVKNKIQYFGPIGGRTPSWVSPLDTKKVEWEANFNNLTGKKIVSLMNEMKSQSRTGATGFGQLNKAELKVISDASMVLKKEMDETTALKYLNKMEVAFNKIISREQDGYEFESGQTPQQGQMQGQGQGVTEEDIQFTMQQNNMTREQVIQALGGM